MTYNDIDLSSGDTKVTAKPAWQYDVGLMLRISGATIPNGTPFHFSSQKSGGKAYIVAATTSGGVTTVKVPDICMVGDNRLTDFWVYCYAVVTSGSTQATVRYEIDLPVRARSGQASQYSQDPYLTAFDRIAAQVAADAQTVGDVVNLKAMIVSTAQQLELKANDANVYKKYEVDAKLDEKADKEDLEEVCNGYQPINITFTDGGYLDRNTGLPVSYSGWKYTNYIPITAPIIIKTDTAKSSDYCVFCDEDKKVINYFNMKNFTFIPNRCKYIRLSCDSPATIKVYEEMEQKKILNR